MFNWIVLHRILLMESIKWGKWHHLSCVGLQIFFTKLLDLKLLNDCCLTIRQPSWEESTAHCPHLTDEKLRHREIKCKSHGYLLADLAFRPGESGSRVSLLLTATQISSRWKPVCLPLLALPALLCVQAAQPMHLRIGGRVGFPSLVKAHF